MERRRVSVIVLGASRFPRAPVFADNPALGRSARALRDYAVSPRGLGVRDDDVLDLFDAELGATDQCKKIREFLEATRDRTATLLIYVGHGSYTREHRKYCFILRGTVVGLETSTGLLMEALLEALRPARDRSLFGLIDCCFAGEAVKHFQGPHDELARRELSSGLPPRGTALLLASSKSDVALAPPDEPHTRFTSALLHVLSSREGPTALSLRAVCARVRSVMAERWPDDHTVCELHTPQQGPEDLAELPYFPIQRDAASGLPGAVPTPSTATVPPRNRPLIPVTIGRASGFVIAGVCVFAALAHFGSRAIGGTSIPVASGVLAGALCCVAWLVLRAGRSSEILKIGVATESCLSVILGVAAWVLLALANR